MRYGRYSQDGNEYGNRPLSPSDDPLHGEPPVKILTAEERAARKAAWAAAVEETIQSGAGTYTETFEK